MTEKQQKCGKPLKFLKSLCIEPIMVVICHKSLLHTPKKDIKAKPKEKAKKVKRKKEKN